jgi:ABC-2 type transport system ATP-binding protein
MLINVNGLRLSYESRHIDPNASLLSRLIKTSYSKREVLKGVELSIADPGISAILGRNGSGKTTLMKLLSGILTPSDGSIEVMGHIPTKRKREFLKSIGAVFGQKKMLWPELSLMENFKLTTALYGVPKSEAELRISELIALFQIWNLLNRPVREYSLGESMKSELANILLFKPKLLFLDEPTIGLDLKSQATLRKSLNEYVRNNFCHILLTSHNMDDIVGLANQVYFLEDGQLNLIGTNISREVLEERLLRS